MKKLLFNRKKLLRAIYLACMTAFLLGSAHAQTVIPSSVIAPYSADLTGDGSFTTTSSSYIGPGKTDTTSSAPSAGGFQQTATSTNFHTIIIGASTTVSNLGGASTSNFIETANMSAGSLSGYQWNMGLIALSGGSVSAYKQAGGFGYEGAVNVATGQLSLSAQVANNGPGSSFGVAGPSLTFNAADTYHLELDGSYGAGNDLTLTLTVTDLSNPLDTATLTQDMGTLTGGLATLTGQNFGTQVNAGNLSSITGTVSNFSVDLAAVPEPSTYALLGAGAGALALALRRRSKLV